MSNSPDRHTRHLDLGCGTKPRNPYARDKLHGIDTRAHPDSGSVEMRQANLALQAIPYPDDHFDSVSAYDFLEHIPRVLAVTDRDGRQGTRLPFIELMNEIWRVLRPGGLFYGCTPAYPHPAAFRDPTHVNILAHDSHIYFTRPDFLARMYGFVGDFSVRRVLWAKGGEFDYEPTETPGFMRRYRLRRRERRGENSHLIWEFEAHKG